MSEDLQQQLESLGKRLGVEDVGKFVRAAIYEVELGGEIMGVDPTPFLPVRVGLRLSDDEWAAFRKGANDGEMLAETLLRSMINFCLTEEPVPRSVFDAARKIKAGGAETKWHDATSEGSGPESDATQMVNVARGTGGGCFIVELAVASRGKFFNHVPHTGGDSGPPHELTDVIYWSELLLPTLEV